MRKLWLMVSLFLFLFVFILSAQTVSASPVWNTSVDESLYSGQRDTSNGVNATNDWANNFSIKWEINQDSATKNYTYSYTLDTTDPGISHFIVEVTKDINEFWYEDANWSKTELDDWSGSQPGNPNLPQEFYGLKFDEMEGTQDVTVSFTTDRAPVWGVFYAKGGSSSGSGKFGTAWSSALDLDDYKTGEDTSLYIARPDSAPIPEPASILLFGTGLLGLAGLGRKRIRKKHI